MENDTIYTPDISIFENSTMERIIQKKKKEKSGFFVHRDRLTMDFRGAKREKGEAIKRVAIKIDTKSRIEGTPPVIDKFRVMRFSRPDDTREFSSPGIDKHID